MFKFPRSSQFLASLAASGGGFCAGQILGWSSPAGPRLLNEIQYFPITNAQWSWISSIYNVGCGISCLFIGLLMEKFGRKKTMLYLVIPLIVGWSLLVWAQNFTMLLSGRFILGLAGGAFYISVPQYTSEISEKEIRGILGSFLQLQVSIGVLFVYVIGAFLKVFWMNVICGLCPIIYALVFAFMPESPIFYILKNREKEAEKSLKLLRDENYKIQEEIQEMKNIYLKNDEKIKFWNAIREKASISALVIGSSLLFFRYMACIIPILFFATTIFEVRKIIQREIFINYFFTDFRRGFISRHFYDNSWCNAIFLIPHGFGFGGQNWTTNFTSFFNFHNDNFTFFYRNIFLSSISKC